MNFTQKVITIAVIVFGTMLTRFIAFIIFPNAKKTPKYIQYLGTLLPSAAFGLLVIYSLKNVSIFSPTHAIPEIIALCIVTALHLWKKQMLISIAGGTIAYMLLVQFVFV